MGNIINKVKIFSIMFFLIWGGVVILSCDNSCKAEETPKSEKVTLASIDVTSNPTKTLYIAGETFNPDGMVVKANYSNGSAKELKSGEYTYSPSARLTENNTKITISYTDDGIKKETVLPIQIGYKITIDDNIENGTVTCGVDRAVAKSPVTVTATPASDEYELENLWYTYIEKSGNEIIRNISLGNKTFDMPSYPITINATFKRKNEVSKYSITLNTVGEKDHVTVTLSHNDGTTLDWKSERIPAGEVIKVSAKPDSDYILPEIPKVSYTDEYGVQQNVEVTIESANIGDFSFTMPASQVILTVSVTKFGAKKLSVKISGDGNVELSVNGESIPLETYLQPETEVTAKITPADGNEITYIKLNGETLESSEKITFEMEDVDSTLEVLFSAKAGYEILQGAVINGELKFSHAKAYKGTTITVTGKPDEGYVAIDSITVTENGIQATVAVTKNSDNEYTFVMPENSVTVSAVFRGYLITIKDSKGGTITSAKSAKAGEEVTLKAVGNGETALGAIVIKNREESLENQRTDTGNGVSEITFAMPEGDVEIEATFGQKIEVKLETTPNNAGIAELYQGKTYIIPANTMYFAAETEVIIETTPGKVGDAIYEVGQVGVKWANGSGSEDVAAVTENKEYTFTVPDKNIIITVVFSISNAKRVYIDTVTGGTVIVRVGTETVTSSSESWLGGDAYVVENTQVTVQATPDDGYETETITWNGESITSGGTFTMPSEEVKIAAKFRKKSYSLTFNNPSNGSFTLSSSYTYSEATKKLSPAGTTYTSGAKVLYGETVYLIATPSNNDYIEQIKVTNTDEGADMKVERLNKDTHPYQFNMPASEVTVNVTFEFSGSDINLWVNDKAIKSFTLNPTPDTATWPTLDKEYYIESENAAGYTQMGYPLKKGDKVQIKDKNGKALDQWEGALGFNKDNPNYRVSEAAYIAEEDGIYKMYYKIWNEKDNTKGYSQWIEIPRTAGLIAADYYLCVNGVNKQKFSVNAIIDNKKYPTLKKELYLNDVFLQEGDKVTIDTNADPAALPDDGILHWEKDNKVGAKDSQPFKVPSRGQYDFYFKIWEDAGTSIWVAPSSN